MGTELSVITNVYKYYVKLLIKSSLPMHLNATFQKMFPDKYLLKQKIDIPRHEYQLIKLKYPKDFRINKSLSSKYR